MPASAASYRKKFDVIVGRTAFDLLPDDQRAFLRQKAFELHFTQQELRIVSEFALERNRWKERPLSAVWPETGKGSDAPARKKNTLSVLRQSQQALRAKENSYRKITPGDKPKTEKPILKTAVRPQLGLGRCPVASRQTRCCNLLTLDAVEKCGFDCSYCSIQSFYHGNAVVFDDGFAEKLKKLALDPDKTYHIGTGQSSDSLMWGNHRGVLAALCEFAGRNPNVILELKTKSKNIGWLLQNDIPPNIICTWTLNPQTIIDHEEHLSAGLAQRLESAMALAQKGCVIGFHFHPIIHYHNWAADYRQICERIIRDFNPDSVAMVSLGTLTFTRSVMKTIRSRPLISKILQMPLEPSAGKLSYPVDIKLEMFKHVYGSLSPWHEKVFFYLCMEPRLLWEPVFGFDYKDNDEFEAAMKSAYFEKIKLNENRAAVDRSGPAEQRRSQ